MVTQDANPAANLQRLTDPVCGMPVDVATPYHHAHGGAMFFFCAEACRARFLADPARFVSMRMQAPEAPPAPRELPAAAARVGEPISAASATPRPAPSSRTPELGLRRGGLRSMIASQILAWREGRYAARTSRELLAVYRRIAAAHPDLGGRALYRRVVMERTGCDTAAADAVLENAEESFAAWPVRRELTLCDVVHYLTVAGFLAAHDGEHWMHADVAHVVASRIPRDLCIIRRNR